MAEDIGRLIDLFLRLQWQPWTIAITFPRYASRRAAPCRVALRRYVVIESRICLATSFQHENKCDCASARTWGRDGKEKEKRRTALVKARPRCINAEIRHATSTFRRFRLRVVKQTRDTFWMDFVKLLPIPRSLGIPRVESDFADKSRELLHSDIQRFARHFSVST